MKLKKGLIPLYRQLEQALRERIHTGHYQAGSMLPNETLLGQEFGVSLITVRQALKLLEDEGLISRQQGRGTFINERAGKFPFEITALAWGSILDLELTNLTIAEKTLLAPRPEIAREMGLKNQEEVFYLEGRQETRPEGGQEGPRRSFFRAWVARDAGEGIACGDHGSATLHDIVSRLTGEHIERLKFHYKPALADEKTGPALGVAFGQPLSVRKVRVVSESQRVLFIIHHYSLGEDVSFDITLSKRRVRVSGRPG